MKLKEENTEKRSLCEDKNFKERLVKKLSESHPCISKDRIIKYVGEIAKSISTELDVVSDRQMVYNYLLTTTTKTQSTNNEIDLSGNTTPADSSEGS
jgi:hypothetical protein